jgi:hypothetical protein
MRKMIDQAAAHRKKIVQELEALKARAGASPVRSFVVRACVRAHIACVVPCSVCLVRIGSMTVDRVA